MVAARNFVVLVFVALLGACRAVSPPVPELQRPVVLQVAEAQLGAPYRFGGASPAGFDCSGLVQYSFARTGLQVPRTAASQQRAAVSIEFVALLPGDLVFFRIGGGATDHVGIYAGEGRFLHAPSSGGVVSYARLDEPFYASRVVGVGRFAPAVAE